MFKTLLVFSLLLLAEDLFYIFVLKDKKFLGVSDENNPVFLLAFSAGIMFAVPYACRVFFKTLAYVSAQCAVVAVIAAAFALYFLFVKKSKWWQYMPSLAVNVCASLYFATRANPDVAAPSVYVAAGVDAVFIMLCVIAYGGVKARLFRFRRPLWQQIACASAALALVVCAFYGVKAL